MDSYSPADVASLLGTSRTRVIRAARRSGMRPATPGGHWRFSREELAHLRAALGRYPADQPRNYSRADLRVLAALQRAPRGVLSARAIARAAGISPTSASTTLRQLADKGLVRRAVVTIAAGSARRTTIWRLNHHHPEWPLLAETLAAVELPERLASPPDPDRVPRRLAHLFWNVDLHRIDLRRDAAFVASRVLRGDDLDALAWATRNLSSEAWEAVARERGLDDARRALALNLAGRRSA